MFLESSPLTDLSDIFETNQGIAPSKLQPPLVPLGQSGEPFGYGLGTSTVISNLT